MNVITNLASILIDVANNVHTILIHAFHQDAWNAGGWVITITHMHYTYFSIA